MKLTRICGVGLLLAIAACGDGGGGPSASDVGTLAYVVTSCRETAGQATVQQELRIYHGRGETVTAMSVGPLGPFTSYGLCARLGVERVGLAGFLGAFQRLGVPPDGSGVVFELTDEFASVGRGLLPAAQRGMYYVRADGGGLRRLGPASRVPGTVFVPPAVRWFDASFHFDPGGRHFTYVDIGPDEAGHEAPQVFVQRLATGERRQLTRLPRVAHAGEPPDIRRPTFIDSQTILFGRFSEPPDYQTFLTVDADDGSVSDVRTLALPGGTLIPAFQIIGGEWEAIRGTVLGEAVNATPPDWVSVSEVFVTDGINALQLTNFRRVDTVSSLRFFSPRDRRVYFNASADPLGTNPLHDCQLFSIEPLTRDLRQVTFFHEGGDHRLACRGFPEPNGCAIGAALLTPPQNPATGTIYFDSQCDPLGLNPNGLNLFAVQPDGTGLQQLTNTRGFVRREDRTVEAEMVEDYLWVYAPPQ